MDCCSTTLVIRGAGTGRGVEEHRCQLANPPSTEGPQQHRDPARSSRNRRGSTRERPRRPETRGARAGSDVVRCRRHASVSCFCLRPRLSSPTEKKAGIRCKMTTGGSIASEQGVCRPAPAMRGGHTLRRLGNGSGSCAVGSKTGRQCHSE